MLPGHVYGYFASATLIVWISNATNKLQRIHNHTNNIRVNTSSIPEQELQLLQLQAHAS